MLSIVHGKQWIHLGLPGPLLRPISKNKKKNHSKSISYIFSQKSFSYISRNRAFLKNFLKGTGTCRARKTQKTHYEKTSYVSGNWTF